MERKRRERDRQTDKKRFEQGIAKTEQNEDEDRKRI